MVGLSDVRSQVCSGGGGRAAKEAETAEQPEDTETRQAEQH